MLKSSGVSMHSAVHSYTAESPRQKEPKALESLRIPIPERTLFVGHPEVCRQLLEQAPRIEEGCIETERVSASPRSHFSTSCTATHPPFEFVSCSRPLLFTLLSINSSVDIPLIHSSLFHSCIPFFAASHNHHRAFNTSIVNELFFVGNVKAVCKGTSEHDRFPMGRHTFFTMSSRMLFKK